MAGTTAEIYIEPVLGKATEVLRDVVAVSQYKDYILPLLFAKFLSENHEICSDKIKGDIADSANHDVELAKTIQEVFLDAESADQVITVYRLLEKAAWNYLRNNAEQDSLKAKADWTFVLLDEILSKRNAGYKGILKPIFVRSPLSTAQVAELINVFSSNAFSKALLLERDGYFGLCEYFIARFALAEGCGAGQFFTPVSVVHMLIKMVEPIKGRIADLACGSGGVFVECIKFAQSCGSDKAAISIYGQERYENTLQLCKINLLLHGLSFNLEIGNSLLLDKFPDLKADYVFMNPTFTLSNWHPERLSENDPRLFGPKEFYTTKSNACFMWLQTAWYYLHEKGTAGIIMASGALASDKVGEGNVREFMVLNNMVDCIVQMSDKLFFSTRISACIFILSKNS